jgi:hypothetical protein
MRRIGVGRAVCVAAACLVALLAFSATAAASESEAEQEVTFLVKKLKAPLGAGQIQVGIASGEEVLITEATSATTAVRNKVTKVAALAGNIVTPVIRSSEEETFTVAPATGYESPGYGGPPLIAGMYYSTTGGSCTLGFYATSPVNPNPFYLTAGHCASASGTDTACTSASSCSTFGSNFGGFVGPGGDYGLIEDNHATEWPPYPAFIDWSCCSGTLPVLGATEPELGETVCHTGYASAEHSVGTSCGTVEELDVPISYAEEGISNIHVVRAGGAGLCAYFGDSGGPVFDPFTAYAKGIFDAITASRSEGGECGRPVYFTSARLAAADMGVTIGT